jgi:predicted amidophosphoribosyltransferase
MAGYGVGAKEARYNTRLSKKSHEQVNLCGCCGVDIPSTELLCKECRGTLGPQEPGNGHFHNAHAD